MMDDLNPLAIILVKKGEGGDRILFRYPFSTTRKPSNQGRNTKIIEDNTNRGDNRFALNDEVGIKNQDFHQKKIGREILTSDNLTEFPSKVLSNLFAVSPQLCDAKFELKINDMRFMGHPVSLEITPKDEKYLPPRMRGKKVSPLTMFHVIFAIKSSAPYSVIQCFHELSQLIGIAIKSEERRIGYLTSEAKIMTNAQEEVVSGNNDDPLSRMSPFQLALERSQLAKDLKLIFDDICFSGVVDAKINKYIEVSMCLPQKVHRSHHPNALVEPEAIFTCLESLRPYHAMLLLYDEKELLDELPLDASPAMRKLIQNSTPLKSFRTLAVDADLSLNQVFQITGHLLYWGKATVIFPLCESNVYVISDVSHFSNSILHERFNERFPSAGESLNEVLSLFSLPSTLSHRSPPHSVPGQQQHLVRLIVWCLQHHLLNQIHTFVTLAINDNVEISLPDPVEIKKRNLENRIHKTSVEHNKKEEPLFSLSEVELKNTVKGTPDSLISGASATSSFGSTTTSSVSQSKRSLQEAILMKDFKEEEINIILQVPAANNLDDLKLFVRLAPYFRGIYHLEEIMYHENVRRAQLFQLIDKFQSILICHEHEDPAVTMYYKHTDK